MEAPIHAASEVDKNETWPRILAVAAGIAILVIACIVVVNSSWWSPPATQQNQASVHVTGGPK